jgi:hypothetical protein
LKKKSKKVLTFLAFSFNIVYRSTIFPGTGGWHSASRPSQPNREMQTKNPKTAYKAMFFAVNSKTRGSDVLWLFPFLITVPP